MADAENRPTQPNQAVAPEPDPREEDLEEEDPLESPAALFDELKLPLPPLPNNLLPQLQQTDDNVFSTRADLTTLTNFDALVQSAAREEGGHYAAFSYEGHGVHNWYVRYCLDTPNLAIFLELPFGSPYRDQHIDRGSVRAAYDQIGQLSEALLARFQDTPVGDIPRYIVEQRAWQLSRWGEVVAPGYPPIWHSAMDPLGDLLKTLRLPE